MYSNIKVYQKYPGTSIKVGCATRSLYASSGPKAEGVPTNNQRGRGSGPCRLWGGLDKARHISILSQTNKVACKRRESKRWYIHLIHKNWSFNHSFKSLVNLQKTSNLQTLWYTSKLLTYRNLCTCTFYKHDIHTFYILHISVVNIFKIYSLN